MPFVLLAVGAIFIVTAVRGTSAEFLNLLKTDLISDRGFVWFVLSIILIASLGYVDEIRPLSDAFLVLVLLVLILANASVFGDFSRQINEAIGG